DDPLVVDLADDLVRVVPDLQAARGLGVLDRVGRHLADRQREVDGAGLRQPGLDRVPVHDGPDRGQVSGVRVRHRIIGVRWGERGHARFAPRGLAIPGHQQTRYTGARNTLPGCGWLREMPNPPDIRRCVHVYPPRTG